MTREIYIENWEDGILKDASSVVLSDSVPLYGIKEKISGDVVIAAGAATVNPSTGKYTYDITALDSNLEYIASFKILRTNGDTEYEEVDIPIVAETAESIYATVAEANEYFSGRLNTDAWDDATAPNKLKALIMSTRIIDRLNYKGEKTDENQERQFPRYNDTEIPEDIKYACCEIALALLDGVDPEMEFENLSMITQNYANVRSTYDRSIVPEHLPAGIPSIAAWRYLKPYLRDAMAVDLSRVS